MTIRSKMMLVALVLALAPLIFVSALSLSALERARSIAVQTASDALRAQAEEDLVRWVADKANLYDAKLDRVHHQVETIVRYQPVESEVANTLPDRLWVAPNGPTPDALHAHASTVALARQYIPLLRASVDREGIVSLGYVAFEDGGVIAFDHDIIDVLDAIKPFDPRQRSWYVAAREAGKAVWVDTYVDANTKKLTTTCAAPIYDRTGAFIGVVGFDVLLETIQQDMLSIDTPPGGSAFLLNQRGDVLLHNALLSRQGRWDQPIVTDNLLSDANLQLRDIARRMTRAEQGVARLTIQNEEVYLAFAPIPSAGWSVGIVVPIAEVIGPAQQVSEVITQRQDVLSGQIILVIALSVVLVSLVSMPVALVLTRPLRELQAAAQRVAAGDLTYRVPESGDYEIANVGRSFNTMTDALREKINELEMNLRQLAALNEVSNQFRTIGSVREQLDAIPKGACECLGFERAVLYLIEQRQLRPASAWVHTNKADQAARVLADAQPIPLESETVAAEVVRSGRAVITGEATAQSPSGNTVQAPLFGREKRVIGLLVASFDTSGRIPTPRDAAQLMTYAGMAGLALENTMLYADLERQVAQRTAELRAALARAQEADRLKSQFLAAVSHELRTPLNAIIGFSTVMLDEIDGPITPLQREDLKIINRNGRFLLHLIDELLDLARIEAGKIDLELAPLDVRALIVEVTETVQGLLHNRHIALNLLVPERLPYAYADAARIRQVLLNLLSNAVKFTTQGSVTVSARCVAAPDSYLGSPGSSAVIVRNGQRLHLYIEVSIRDTGIGIAPEDLPRIFEAFHQVRSGDRRRGSGLGLAISRRLIEAHGGRIWAESEPGKGSIFTFILPCAVVSRSNRPDGDSDPAGVPAVQHVEVHTTLIDQ
ncbi:MAG: ATP-binding protein [Roseiflexus sp.]|nr:ATP-binding protein [Roseiflexus sp.]MCS7288956.1 ATP-binding protein [Roseiflexus sp.]MDW8231680.1 ATP-binding protein [Roseiflexaceae bacterium]